MFDVAVVGRTVWDDWVLPSSPYALGPTAQYGGSGANIAVHLAHLGLRVTLVTAIGNDERSRRYAEYLDGVGVDLSLAVQSEAPLARCRITPQKHYDWVGGRMGFPEFPQGHELALRSKTAAAVYCDMAPSGSVALPQACFWVPQLYLSSLRKFDPAVWSAWRLVFLNSSEARQLEAISNSTVAGVASAFPGTSWIVTNEGAPTVVARGERISRFKVPPTASLVSIGGGDAFAAGVCAGDIWGWPEGKSVRLGHALAKRVVGQVGCQLPRKAIRQALLECV